MKLAWRNLLENNCPRCGDPLGFSPQEDKYVCSIFCGMMIKRTTVDRIVARFNKEEYEEEPPLTAFEEMPDVIDNMGSSTIQDYQQDE